MAGIHAGLFQACDEGCAKRVGPDLSDHGDASSQPAGRAGLIGALTSSEKARISTEDRFAFKRQARHGKDDVHVCATDHDNGSVLR